MSKALLKTTTNTIDDGTVDSKSPDQVDAKRETQY